MLTKEKLNHHITHLEDKHRKLDNQINLMESVGNYKDEDLHYFKKQKLALKDEIETVKAQLAELA